MLIIEKITAASTFEVRHPVLRKGKPIESCDFEGDDLASTQHFGLFENNHLVGVISVFEKDNVLFPNENQAQIRGMAILENHQKKGFGQLLIEHCENVLQMKKKSLIWFNARENAIEFYKKMGYNTFGNEFEINGIGTHYVMYKNLSY